MTNITTSDDVSVALPVRKAPAFQTVQGGSCANATCGAPLRPTNRRVFAKFCSEKCKNAHHNRKKVQGAALVTIAKRWRRDNQKGDFTLMTRLISQLIEMDRIDGVSHYPDPPIEAYQIRSSVSNGKR